MKLYDQTEKARKKIASNLVWGSFFILSSIQVLSAKTSETSPRSELRRVIELSRFEYEIFTNQRRPGTSNYVDVPAIFSMNKRQKKGRSYETNRRYWTQTYLSQSFDVANGREIDSPPVRQLCKTNESMRAWGHWIFSSNSRSLVCLKRHRFFSSRWIYLQTYGFQISSKARHLCGYFIDGWGLCRRLTPTTWKWRILPQTTL